MLVLESMAHAKARGAKILAELCGFGMTSDSKDMVNPDIDGPSEAMRLALEDAELAPTDIDYLNAHGTATTVNDRNETNAIKRVFGKHAYNLRVSSTKSMHGHPLGAGGGIEAVACIKAMEEGWVPPTIGLDEADPECDLDYVPNVGRDQKRSPTPCRTPFAFGGLNAVLVFRPPSGVTQLAEKIGQALSASAWASLSWRALVCRGVTSSSARRKLRASNPRT